MLKCLAAALALGAVTLASVVSALNVHIVCHTHDDVGWLKTVDQYFKGANSTIQHASVQYILDSVILALQANPLRKFIYVEQAFFQRWYREQDSEMKKTVKRLVATGQLEFINGGWCMHDEAATHYVDMIDQTTLGHRFIKSEFGQIPRVGWQIDPFGHSSTQASLLSAEVGFDGLFFGRMDYQDHDIRMKDQNMEFVWRASPSMGSSAEIFTKAFQNGNYGPPDGFCFDQSCNDAQPIQDDPLLEDYNVQDRVDGFVAQALQQSKATKGSNIMFTMGSDFQYENANEWFKNLDKLIEYVNRDGRVNAFYSTPSQYLDAKFEEEIVFSVKTDDFFPYADNEHAYWTGYFTSRPALKRYVRMSSGLLQTFRQIEAFGGGDGSSTEMLYQAQSVAQHHDAVSGTSRQHVAYDYAKRISKGVDIATVMTQENIGNWLVKGSSTPPVMSNCFLTNVSVCTTSQSKSSFVVVAYNPLARSRTELISIPFSFGQANVSDANGVIMSEVTPILNNSAIPRDAAPYVLRFMATIPALGYSSFAVVPVPSPLEPSKPVFSVENHESEKDDDDDDDDSDIKSNDSPSISNGLIRVDFQAGLVSQITNLTSRTSLNLKQEFLWYASYADAPGDNTNPSGAYIFRPNSTSAYPVSSQSSATVQKEGPIVWEIHQVIASWLTQIVRLKANSYEVEFEYTVGSIPIDDGVGKEVIIRYTSSLDSKGEMITDSNGRETLLRTFGARPTWNWTTLEPVAGNYYPVNAFASISDSSNRLTILTDRSQGVASLSGGQMEFMVHRRVLHDDWRGVTEPLNETDSAIYTIKDGNVDVTRVGNGLIITGTHTLLFSPESGAALGYRTLQQRLFAPLFLSYTPFSGSGKDWFNAHTSTRSFCKTELPLNVELMTLQPWGKSQILLRLAHNFAVNEDPKYSSSVTVDLASLFSQWTIKSVTEMSLTANQPLANVKRLKWNTLTKKQDVKRGFVQGTVVTLTPMEIVTLLVDIDN